MKRVILSPVFLFVLGMILVINCKANSVPKETYSPQMIIDAPWGKEPGQFGIYKPPEGGPRVGPLTFTISPQGKIYIFDPENSRIQKFDSEGRFISLIMLTIGGLELCVDQYENIYLYDGSLVPKRIIKCDDKGNVLMQYLVVWENNGMGWDGGGLYCDNSGRLFLSYRSDSLKVPMIFQVGTTEIVFTEEQQKATLREGFVGSNNVVLNQGKIFQTKEGKLNLVELDTLVQKPTKMVKEFNLYRLNLYPYGQAGFTDVDNEMNVYTTQGNTIRKYNSAGDLVVEFTIEKDDYVWTSRSLVLDEHGNVYVMSTSEDGLKIIKWSPIEGEK